MPWALTVLAAVTRLLPHPFNVTPLGAVGLFAGANCRLAAALLVPAIALLIGDAARGFYQPVVMLSVYAGMLTAPLFGQWLLKDRRSWARYGGAIGGSSISFFLISNFGIWLAGYYPKSVAGLIDCYLMGLPFLGRTLLANSLYCAALFGGYRLIQIYANRLITPQRH